jgi:hypothetical protein
MKGGKFFFSSFFVWLGEAESTWYVGESNENRKTEIKIRNITPLSYKLADMLAML